MNEFQGIPNWIIKPLQILEQQHSGVLSEFFAASAPRRSLLAAAIALQLHAFDEGDTECLREIAQRFQYSKSKDIVAACVTPQIVASFRCLVCKNADTIQAPKFYQAVHAWLIKHPAKQKLKALTHSRSFSIATLEALDILDPIAILPATLEFIRNANHARILNSHLRFVRAACPRISDAELRREIKTLGRDYASAFQEFSSSDREWFEKPTDIPDRLMKHVRLPAPPFPPSNIIEPISSVARMVEVALRYRNCLRQKIVDVVMGDRYYALYHGVNSLPFVLEFINDRPAGWRLASIHGHGDEEIVGFRAISIIADIEAIGIPYLPSWQTGLMDDVEAWRGSRFLASWNETSMQTETIAALIMHGLTFRLLSPSFCSRSQI